jgi:hypothetical protein
MKVITAFGKENTCTFGFLTDKQNKNIKCISIIILEIMWNKNTKRWGIGVGIPFVFGIGIMF